VIVELVDCTSGSSFRIFCVYRTDEANQQLFVSRFFRLSNWWSKPAALRFAFFPFIEPVEQACSSSFRFFSVYRTDGAIQRLFISCFFRLSNQWLTPAHLQTGFPRIIA